MGTGGGNLSGYFTVALVVLSLGAALCVRDLVLWARVYTRVNSVLKGAVWITLGGTVLAGVQMAVAVQGLRHGGLRGDRGEWSCHPSSCTADCRLFIGSCRLVPVLPARRGVLGLMEARLLPCVESPHSAPPPPPPLVLV
jgi:hypothetical protein